MQSHILRGTTDALVILLRYNYEILMTSILLIFIEKKIWELAKTLYIVTISYLPPE